MTHACIVLQHVWYQQLRICNADPQYLQTRGLRNKREIPILRRLHSELWGGSVWWWTPFLISQSDQLRSSSSNTIQCSLYFQLYCNSVDVCIGTLLISIWTVGGERHRIGADTGRCSPKINCSGLLWQINAKRAVKCWSPINPDSWSDIFRMTSLVGPTVLALVFYMLTSVSALMRIEVTA